MDERHHRRDRKERVLHTRISEQLSEDIRRLAEDLRVPTSNLVRNVLEEVFTVVENVSEDVGELFEDVIEEAEAARERIRRRHHHHGRGHGYRRHRQADSRGESGSWADVAEAELRDDERAERPGPPVPEPGGAAPEAESPPRPGPDPQRSGERPQFAEVIGWQPLVLNHTQDCADCGRTIPRGSRAFVGLTEKGLSRTTLCRTCLLRR